MPTVAESGLAGYEIIGWYAVLAPAGTPRAIVDVLDAQIRKVLQTVEMKERFLGMGLDPIGAGPAELRRFMQSEIGKWDKVIKATGARVD